jgi:hypothetical protein
MGYESQPHAAVSSAIARMCLEDEINAFDERFFLEKGSA